MKAAAAVLGASLLFFIGVLTGAGRREAVPPPTAIPLGATGGPAVVSPGAPDSGTKRTTTTTARSGGTAPATGTTPTSTSGPTPTTVATTGATATTATTAASSTTTSTESGQVQQVDNQVDCTSARKGKGKREPCPSTTSSTRRAPGGGGNG